MVSPRFDDRSVNVALSVLNAEVRAISRCITNLDDGFRTAGDLILSGSGRLVTIGIGKSGYIAAKLAATFASTGTPALFVHAADAVHGDLGMIVEDDVALILSHSGETPEIKALLPLLHERGVTILAITDNRDSSLARSAAVVLFPGCEQEADVLGVAPTSSTTAALALGDALAIAVAATRGFTIEQFLQLHPGGALGEKLRTSDS